MATDRYPRPNDAARLTPPDLARRWLLSPRTLEKWRQTDRGPPYLRIGGRVAYRLEDVVAFETANLRGGR